MCCCDDHLPSHVCICGAAIIYTHIETSPNVCIALLKLLCPPSLLPSLPLTPQPVFHVVNATHIKVQWDIPFALPKYDVRNYTLLIGNINTSSSTHIQCL